MATSPFPNKWPSLDPSSNISSDDQKTLQDRRSSDNQNNQGTGNSNSNSHLGVRSSGPRRNTFAEITGLNKLRQQAADSPRKRESVADISVHGSDRRNSRVRQRTMSGVPDLKREPAFACKCYPLLEISGYPNAGAVGVGTCRTSS